MGQRRRIHSGSESILLSDNSRLPDGKESARRPILVAAFLAAGILIWLGIGGGRGIGVARWAIIAGAAALSFLPAVAKFIERNVDRIRHPSSPNANWAAVAIAIISAAYFILTAFLQDRDLFPKTHDDCSYMIQMQMLARGRLWMPGLPLPDFFDSFYLIVRPVYASQYFPGTALLYVPTIWLHLPTWVMPVLAAGTVVGLTYRILTELIDGVAGALGALWITSLTWFRMASILLMSQVPALLLGLIMVWAWLCWRRHRRAGWLLLIGIAAGWCAITRPVDALCFAIPVGVAILVDLIKSNPRQWAIAGVLLVAGAAPFLAIQLVFNEGVTGHLFQTPFRMYLDRDVPGTQFGFPAGNSQARPQSVVPEKQEYYSNWVMPYIGRHRPDRLLQSWAGRWFPMIVDTTMPCRAMLPLAMVGLLGLRDRRRWVLWATVPLFALLYAFYTIFLEHYAIAIMPATAMVCLPGIDEIGDAAPKFRRSIVSALAMFITVACITSFWEINRLIAPAGKQIEDETIRSPMLRGIEQDIPNAADLKKPAVFLFRYHRGGNFFEEPVYNTGVAWPDDAEIIHAHDLGAHRDREIIEYYANRKPVREFYLYDEKSADPITDLGPDSDPDQILKNLARAELGTK